MLNEQARRVRNANRVTACRRVVRWARTLYVVLIVALGLQCALVQAQTVYFHNDPMGSPIAASDEAGNLLWRESYRPYGERMLKPAAANTQWFHGKPLDPDTGMEDFGARNYDPKLGRFLSIDPVDFSGQNIHSFNRYAYGNNNPLKFKDPDGRHPVLAVLGFGLVVNEIATSDVPILGGGAVRTAAGAVSEMSAKAVAAERLFQNAARGKAAEVVVKGELGAARTGQQVTFKVGDQVTRIDFTANVAGKIGVVEVKTGMAVLSDGQKALRKAIKDRIPVTPVGTRAEEAGFISGVPVLLDFFKEIRK